MIIGICIGLIILIFVGDLWIKNYIEKHYVENGQKSFLGGLLILKNHHNRGFALNLGEKKQLVVAGISTVFVLCMFMLFLISLGQRGNHLLRIGLAMIVGGGFSNTYDRLRRKYVVDYVSFNVKWKKLNRIVFNCSDFCIIIGALLTALGAER